MEKVLVDNEEIDYVNDYDKSEGTIKKSLDTFREMDSGLVQQLMIIQGHSVTTETTPYYDKNDSRQKQRFRLLKKIRFFNKDGGWSICCAADSLSITVC